MAASMKPAGFYEDDSDEDGFVYGDEGCLEYNQTDATQGFPSHGNSAVQSRVSFGTASHSKFSEASLVEDFRMAVIQGNLKAVADALDKGVDVNVVFSTGWSALMYAGNNAKGDIFKLLLDKGANPNYHKDLYTILMATCGSSSQKAEVLIECVKLLLEKGVEINTRDRYHVTPLMYAAREGRLEIVQLLLDKGTQIDRQDTRGFTALSWATQRNRLGVMKLLLQRGADKNKKHSDNLTAIDLARGREEVVWLFEGRPGGAEEMGAGDAVPAVGDAAAAAAASATTAASEPAPKPGTSNIKYGDLEVFLFGLELGQFYNLFQQHQVDFPLLLTLNEDDLEKMGITQAGVRKKLLEGTAAVHKRNWESSSLVPIRIKSQVKCPDAIAIVANLSKHLRYISSSVTYIKDHLKRDADFLTTSQDGTAPRQLLLHTGDGIKNAATLQQELNQLYSALGKELASSDFDPPDIITQKTISKRKVRNRRLAMAVIGVSVLALLIWKRETIRDKLTAHIHGTIREQAVDYLKDFATRKLRWRKS